MEEHGVIVRGLDGRSSYALVGYDPEGGWGKLPARGLYVSGKITAFQHFKLRQPGELDALKTYFAFVARRDRKSNLINLSYDRLATYAGIQRARIRTALSILAVNGLAHVERVPSTRNDYGVANAYRLTHLDPYVHAGTRGRSEAQAKALFAE